MTSELVGELIRSGKVRKFPESDQIKSKLKYLMFIQIGPKP